MVALYNPLEIAKKILKFLGILALTYGIAWGCIYFFQNHIKSIDNAKIISEIVNNLAVSVGIVTGGIWAYYQYIKGRLFSPKIHLSYSNSIIRMSNKQVLVLLEFSIKNIGSVRVIPEDCLIQITGFKINEGDIVKYKILEKRLLPSFKKIEEDGISIWSKFKSENLDVWYIEPNEIENLNQFITIASSYEAFSTEITFFYNKSLVANQTFVVNLSEKKQK